MARAAHVPLESKFSDMEFARRVYGDLVDALLARGSTTTVYLGSAHLESSIELAAICAEKGQRALVGKTVMDDPAANPEYYRDASPAQAVGDTATLIKEVEAIGRASKQGIWPVITPRFIPSCTDEVLRGLGDLAASTGAYVQTHCNEGQWEHDVVLERFGKTDPYALRDFRLGKRAHDHGALPLRHGGRGRDVRRAGCGDCPLPYGEFVFLERGGAGPTLP